MWSSGGGSRDEARSGDGGRSQDRNRSDATSGRSGPQPIEGMFQFASEGTAVGFRFLRLFLRSPRPR